jgi:gamma-glutamyltranspeptidase/glutathione hydrolase
MTTSAKALACGLILSIVLTPPLALAKTPVATGTGGAVATISEKASQSALAILNKGGNAIDAAVAAAATLGVTDPFSCGIGGGGFMVIYLAKDKRVITIDHRETAPASFSPNVFLENGKEIDFETAVASGAPSACRAPCAAGTKPWSATARCPSSRCWPRRSTSPPKASRSAKFFALTRENERKFGMFETQRSSTCANGKAVPAGHTLRNPDMAKAYREIAARGYKAFYEGPMAQAIVDAVNRPPVANGGRPGAPGTMTLADLANYEARIRQPVRSTYRGYESTACRCRAAAASRWPRR